MSYFLRTAAAASRAAPMAARMVAIPTGDFCVIPAAGGATGTAALWTGTCAGALVATGTAVDADDIINEVIGIAREEVQKRNPKIPKKELEKRAHAIGLAAFGCGIGQSADNLGPLFRP